MAGRPQEYRDRLTTSVRLDRALHARLVSAAAQRDISVNLIVNKAIADFLDRLLPVEEIVLTRRGEPRP